MKNKLKYLIAIVLVVVFSSSLVVCASAEESTTETDTAALEAEEKNLFSAAYEEISAYASEILCGLTLAASLILAFAYKKGLLPLVQGALVSIGNSVSKIKDSAKENEEQTARIEENLKSNMQSANDILNSVIERIDSLDAAMSKRLGMDALTRAEYQKLGIVVEAQIDMLYDIFMSSALPQYKKDAVGERIGKMKEAMARDEQSE